MGGMPGAGVPGPQLPIDPLQLGGNAPGFREPPNNPVMMGLQEGGDMISGGAPGMGPTDARQALIQAILRRQGQQLPPQVGPY